MIYFVSDVYTSEEFLNIARGVSGVRNPPRDTHFAQTIAVISWNKNSNKYRSFALLQIAQILTINRRSRYLLTWI